MTLELALTAGLSIVSAFPAQPRPRPNIVVLLVDNVRADELGITGHPYLKTPNLDRLAKEGAIFRSYYVTTPLCSPSRASILTGQYMSRHGIIDNTNRSRASHQLHTFAQDLQQLGYETAYLGKWHMGNDPTPRPGWNYWVSYKGQGDYLNPDLFRERTAAARRRLCHRHHGISYDGMDEMYDLERDPFELTNLFARPELRTELRTLQHELARLVSESVGL